MCLVNERVLNKVNLHLNMPAQLCSHLLGPTLPIVHLDFCLRDRRTATVEAFFRFCGFAFVPPYPSVQEFNPKRTTTVEWIVWIGSDLYLTNISPPIFSMKPLQRGQAGSAWNSDPPNWALVSLPQWYPQLSVVFSGVIFQYRHWAGDHCCLQNNTEWALNRGRAGPTSITASPFDKTCHAMTAW